MRDYEQNLLIENNCGLIVSVIELALGASAKNKHWRFLNYISCLSLFCYQCPCFCEVPHQYALLGKGESRLHGHDNDEREETEDIDEAAAEAGNVGLVEEGADEVTEGQDAQAVIAEVKEK